MVLNCIVMMYCFRNEDQKFALEVTIRIQQHSLIPQLVVIQGSAHKFWLMAQKIASGTLLGSPTSGDPGHDPLTPYRSPEQAKKWPRKCLQLSAGKRGDTW